MRQVVSAPDAPKAMGAYSPAIKAGNLLFISGQIPVDPSTGNLIQGDIAAQAEQVMRNLTALLRAAGAGFDHVVRTTVYLADMNDFAGDERGLQPLHRRSAAGTSDRPGRETSARREDRGRRDRRARS